MVKIKFYSVEDLSSGYYLDLVKDYIKYTNIDSEKKDINEILELYNVSRYCEEFKVELPSEDLKQFLSKINKNIGKFFANFSLVKNGFDYEEIESMYKDDFWAIFKRYGLLKKNKCRGFYNIFKIK